MKLTNKYDSEIKIIVNSKKNEIILKKGFVVITSGSHYGAVTLRPDILVDNYDIPKHVTIKD